jgi:hypothetical protein
MIRFNPLGPPLLGGRRRPEGHPQTPGRSFSCTSFEISNLEFGAILKGLRPCTLFGQARHYRCLPERLPACLSLPPLLHMPFPRNLSSWKRGAGVQSSRLTFNPLGPPLLGGRRRPEGYSQTPGGKHAAPLLRQPPCITLTGTLGLNRTPDIPQTDNWHLVPVCSWGQPSSLSRYVYRELPGLSVRQFPTRTQETPRRPLVEKPSKPERGYIMASRRRLYWSTVRAVLMPPPDAL